MNSFLLISTVVAILVLLIHAWLHLTNPYARWNIVQRPYDTIYRDGHIILLKQFKPRVYSGLLARILGYYKSGFMIVQNTHFGSRRTQATSSRDIIKEVHHVRFDPTKPYLISGDQFSVLYPRNLGVFYNDFLNPATAHDNNDLQNRERIYLQSALYALDAFSQANKLTTTIVPIGRRSAVLTQVHPGSIPSDSLYGILYALQSLRSTPAAKVVETIIKERMFDLKKLLDIYLDQVQDVQTGLVRRSAHLAAARDGVVRQSSFYDNVILWKTRSLASDLGLKVTQKKKLATLRQQIIATFWDDKKGCFKDDIRSDLPGENYSSDWLIALPTGFLDPAYISDRKRLERIVSYIHKHGIARPLPIKYTASAHHLKKPWAVRTFVSNYGGEAIWSYWGAQYLTLLADLYLYTKETTYRTEVEEMSSAYKQTIERDQGFAETFTPEGDFLQNLVYKSIRQTGWVVQFETALAKMNIDL